MAKYRAGVKLETMGVLLRWADAPLRGSYTLEADPGNPGFYMVRNLPIFSCNQRTGPAGEPIRFGASELREIEAHHRGLERTGHYPPVFEGHHVGGEDRPKIGNFKDVRLSELEFVDPKTHKPRKCPTLFATIHKIKPQFAKRMLEGDLEYRSIEIRPGTPRISGLSMSSTVPPFFKYPNLTVTLAEGVEAPQVVAASEWASGKEITTHFCYAERMSFSEQRGQRDKMTTQRYDVGFHDFEEVLAILRELGVEDAERRADDITLGGAASIQDIAEAVGMSELRVSFAAQRALARLASLAMQEPRRPRRNKMTKYQQYLARRGRGRDTRRQRYDDPEKWDIFELGDDPEDPDPLSSPARWEAILNGITRGSGVASEVVRLVKREAKPGALVTIFRDVGTYKGPFPVAQLGVSDFTERDTRRQRYADPQQTPPQPAPPQEQQQPADQAEEMILRQIEALEMQLAALKAQLQMPKKPEEPKPEEPAQAPDGQQAAAPPGKEENLVKASESDEMSQQFADVQIENAHLRSKQEDLERRLVAREREDKIQEILRELDRGGYAYAEQDVRTIFTGALDDQDELARRKAAYFAGLTRPPSMEMVEQAGEGDGGILAAYNHDPAARSQAAGVLEAYYKDPFTQRIQPDPAALLRRAVPGGRWSTNGNGKGS